MKFLVRPQRQFVKKKEGKEEDRQTSSSQRVIWNQGQERTQWVKVSKEAKKKYFKIIQRYRI